MSSTSEALPEPLAALLEGMPRLDASFGAVLVGTYVSLVCGRLILPSTMHSYIDRLYGLTIHQAFRYFRIYKQDVPRLKILVGTVESLNACR